MDKRTMVIMLNFIEQGILPESSNKHLSKEDMNKLYEYVTPITNEYIDKRSEFPRMEPEEIMEGVYNNRKNDGIFKLTELGLKIEEYKSYKKDGKDQSESCSELRCDICKLTSGLVNWQREYEGK